MNFQQVKDNAVGKWPGIMSALGIDVGDGQHKSCPICKTEKKHFRFDDRDGLGTFICTCCSGDGWLLVEKVCDCDFKEAIEQVAPLVGRIPVSARTKEPTITPEKLREIFLSSSVTKKGDPVFSYLTGRGLTKIPKVLRYHPACWESETKRNQIAMLAVFHGVDGAAATMHRTYIDLHGRKMKIEKVRKVLPCLKKMTGGAVRLFEAGETLGIAEGIETAIAASEMMGIPVWSALNSSLLSCFEPPQGVKTLAIIGDNDRNYAGQKAAYTLANKVALKGDVQVNVYLPAKPDTDWNDILVEENARKPRV